MTEAERELVWLAGLLEGEGAFCFVRASRSPKSTRLVVTLAMTDRDVVEHAARAFPGAGNITVRNRQRKNWNDQFNVRWEEQAAHDLMQAILPFMHERRSLTILQKISEWKNLRTMWCHQCGQEFFAKDMRQRYCDKACQVDRTNSEARRLRRERGA